MATPYPRRVDEVELQNLATRIAPSYYQQLGTNLGISHAQLEQVKTQHQLVMKDALKDILVRWQCDRSTEENTRETLADILEKSGLGQLADQLRKCDEEIRPKGTKPASPTSQQTTAPTRLDIHVNQPTPVQPSHNSGLGGIVSSVANMMLNQHNSHIYNATSQVVKVVLRDQNNDDTTNVLSPKQHCRIAISNTARAGECFRFQEE
ncbi:uncharacterized protein [Diadema antillarum]|uniref:uncharacterized protein n=1 Tax=Diadema antillarum TaxID=105358 RepID=UPI003A8380A5